MKKRMLKKILGAAIIAFVFGWMFAEIALAVGIKAAVITFLAAAAMAGLLLLAVYLLCS